VCGGFADGLGDGEVAAPWTRSVHRA
jgi:hypothetical protein